MLANNWDEPCHQKTIIHLLHVRLDVDKPSLRTREGIRSKGQFVGVMCFTSVRYEADRELHIQSAGMLNY